MDIEKAAADGGGAREGTPLRSLPGFTVDGRPAIYISRPQVDQPWTPAHQRDYAQPDPTAISVHPDSSDADSISSSTGGLFSSISVPVPQQLPAQKGGKCSLSPTPSFTYIDAKAAAAARKQTASCCASKVVLKITLTFCVSFLLGMALTVIYMEVYLWRRR